MVRKVLGAIVALVMLVMVSVGGLAAYRIQKRESSLLGQAIKGIEELTGTEKTYIEKFVFELGTMFTEWGIIEDPEDEDYDWDIY